MACSPVAVDSSSLLSLPSFPFKSDPSRLAALLLLVCAACPVSVSVRLACVRRTRSTRDPGHHSRFVQYFFLLLAAAAPALGFDGGSCGNSIHRVEPLPKARGVRGLRARSNDARWGTGRGTNRVARLYGVMRQGAHHWVAALAKSAGNPRRCVPVRSVTTGKPLVTLQLPQTNCRRNAAQCWRRDRSGRGRCGMPAGAYPGALRKDAPLAHQAFSRGSCTH